MFGNIWPLINSCYNQEEEEVIDSKTNINLYDVIPLQFIDRDDLEKKKIAGLSNFEGNCYLNSILQCFYYCKDLTNFFIRNENEIIKKGGKLSNAYLKLILRLNKKKKYNDAKILLNALQDVSYNFFKKGGNDPKAALFYLLENLHNELKEQNLNYKEEDICCEDIDQERVFQRCKNNEENNKSIISELFNWCLLTKNECKKCGNIHYMCEYQNNILIALNKYETKEKNVKLDNLIKFYFKDVEKHFFCNFGKEVFKVKFHKEMISLPQYLIIILNRKIIQFNIQYEDFIDLSEYCTNENNAKYKFIGTSLTNDYEDKEGTHAISRCMTLDGVYIFNDLTTIKCCNNNINGYNPYILFYKKI